MPRGGPSASRNKKSIKTRRTPRSSQQNNNFKTGEEAPKMGRGNRRLAPYKTGTRAERNLIQLTAREKRYEHFLNSALKRIALIENGKHQRWPGELRPHDKKVRNNLEVLKRQVEFYKERIEDARNQIRELQAVGA